MLRQVGNTPVWDHRTSTSAISVGAGSNVAITPPSGARRMALSVLEQAGEDLFITDNASASAAEGFKIGGAEHAPTQIQWSPSDVPALRALNTSGAAVNLGVVFFYG